MARPLERERVRRTSVLLWLVLLLVLIAFGLLVAALVTSETGWAWGSVGASGVAAGLLVADWTARRRRPEPPPPAPVADTRPDVQEQPAGDIPGEEPDTELDPSVEPPEETADVADAITVSDLTDEVVVIDERPRYHLSKCRWVGERETIPLPVNEARELGFTPCAICGPDSWLAAVHRAASR